MLLKLQQSETVFGERLFASDALLLLLLVILELALLLLDLFPLFVEISLLFQKSLSLLLELHSLQDSVALFPESVGLLFLTLDGGKVSVEGIATLALSQDLGDDGARARVQVAARTRR